MSIGLLGGIVFVVVFAGIILVHELGHFFIARLMKIEVEEIRVRISPRLLRLWRGRGSLLVGKDRIEIPINFDIAIDPRQSLHSQVNIVAIKEQGNISCDPYLLNHWKMGNRCNSQLLKVNLPRIIWSNSPSSGMTGSNATALIPGEIRLNGILNEIRPGTEFTLNWIPLGGFNKIKGEDDPETPGGMAAANPWKRLAVLVAGASINLLTAVLVYTFFFYQVGVPDTHTVVISGVDSPSPAQQAGIQVGDVVVAAGGQPVDGYTKLTQITHNNLGLPLQLVILRDGKALEIIVTPRTVYPSTQGPMGVSIGEPLIPVSSWFNTIPAAFSATWQDVDSLLALPGRLIAGTISPQAAQIGGPRTVWNLFQQAVSRDVTSREASSTGSTSTKPTNYTLLIIISITVTTAVANLLPIPAFDGGRIFMTLPEIFIKRRIPARYQAMINGIGFLILVTLLGFFYLKDIISPVNFTLP